MSTHRQCDGFSRRDVIRIGAIGAAGLSLDQMLRIEAASAANSPVRRDKPSAIFVELPGGPSHIDTFDLKPDSPKEFRGTFNPIKTNVDGIEICEHLPKLAKCADKFAILRGVSHSLGAHPLGQRYINTGNRPLPSLEFPAFGSVAAKLLPGSDDLPSYVAIPRTAHGPGYLGVKYAPLATNAAPRQGQAFNVRGITLGGGLNLDEIQRRHDLLGKLDQQFASLEKSNDLIGGLDKFSQQAFNMITSRSTREAFDISKESNSFSQNFGEDPFSQSCLLATRLIESGIRFVTLTLGGWDTHQDNFTRLKDNLLPRLDGGLAALFTGLAEKGLLDTTTVYVTGEFGRTPKINSRSAEGGRDHYPRCMCMLMGGGKVRGGQVIGESDDTASGPRHEGISPDDVAASFYHSLGIDHTHEFETSTGRPVMIVREGKIVDELFA